MDSIINIFDKLSLTLLKTLNRFSLASFSAFLVSLISILLIEIDYSQGNEIAILAYKVAFVLSLGVFLFPVLHLLNRSIYFKLIGFIVLGGYFYILPMYIDVSTVSKHLLLIIALSFMFFWAPFFNTEISNINIWEWTVQILLNLLVTIILTSTIFIVFYILFYYLHKLFGLEILDRRYLQFVIFVIGIFSVNFFLSQMPKYIFLLQLKKYTQIGEIFTKYVLTPVTILYLLVLFAYIFKIFIMGLWSELVSIDLMVIGYTVVSISTYMFWTPLVENFLPFFKSLIWKPLFLLSAILALSIFIRLVDGGNLKDFYLLILFDIWLGLISIYFLLYEKASYKWLFFSISLLIGVSQSEYILDFMVGLVTI